MPVRVAVTDACIFIDLINLKIISDFFNLDIELHTTSDVVRELYPDQQEILKAYESGNKLVIHTLTGDEINEMESMPFSRGLSLEDRTVLFIATKLEDPLILSSDKLVCDHADNLSIEYHGIFWIFDQLVVQQILTKLKGATKIKELLQLNTMYSSPSTKKEADKRIQSWGI